MIGNAVGVLCGIGVGSTAGASVGLIDETGVGALDGFRVAGAEVWTTLGRIDGDIVGESVDNTLTRGVGAKEGRRVGLGVDGACEKEGLNVGFTKFSEVGMCVLLADEGYEVGLYDFSAISVGNCVGLLVDLITVGD